MLERSLRSAPLVHVTKQETLCAPSGFWKLRRDFQRLQQLGKKSHKYHVPFVKILQWDPRRTWFDERNITCGCCGICWWTFWTRTFGSWLLRNALGEYAHGALRTGFDAGNKKQSTVKWVQLVLVRYNKDQQSELAKLRSHVFLYTLWFWACELQVPRCQNFQKMRRICPKVLDRPWRHFRLLLRLS